MGADDIIAVEVLVASKKVELIGVLVCEGLCSVEKGSENARKLLNFLNLSSAPVAKGIVRNRELSGEDKVYREISEKLLSNLQFDKESGKITDEGVDFLEKQILNNPGEIVIFTLGPLTNIASLVKKNPKIFSQVKKIVIMGGALEVRGNTRNGAEWNFAQDPESVKVVLTAPSKKVLVPLDITNQVPITLSLLEGLSNCTNPLAQIASSVLLPQKEWIEKGKYFLWDPLAVLVEIEKIPLLSYSIGVYSEGERAGKLFFSPQGSKVFIPASINARRELLQLREYLCKCLLLLKKVDTYFLYKESKLELYF